MDTKCAPGITYEQGSCILTKDLKQIAKSFNTINPTQVVDINKSKLEIVNELGDKIKNIYKCDNQLCWLNQSFVKRLNNKDLMKFTFKPTGPTQKFDWLNTTHINNVINQYEKKYKNFSFLGSVPYDFQELRELQMGKEIDFDMLRNGKLNEENSVIDKFGMVINLDPHDKGGSHWVALYVNFEEKQIYFFDSVGKKPRKKIKKFINKITKYLYKKEYNEPLNINKIIQDIKQTNINEDIEKLKIFDIRHNKIQHQFKNSECGVYSINFIIRLVGGETFDMITNNILDDDFMNNCRKTYFIN
jgi:hypothetical protein